MVYKDCDHENEKLFISSDGIVVDKTEVEVIGLEDLVKELRTINRNMESMHELLRQRLR